MSRLIDFAGICIGVIGKKLPSDSTLNNMRKSELIELLHIAEHNYKVLSEFYTNAIDDSKCKKCPLGNYNVDKVVEDLELLKKFNLNIADSMIEIQKYGIGRHYICLEDAIEIVKKGGKNE